ncbi:MAG TPA: hypothetical protein VHN58_09195 [Croceicoccus sp.]|nr:hypothetical protein [Croceicoccus sp.]
MARFTLTDRTPATAAIAFSTLPTQEAHVIPSTEMVSDESAPSRISLFLSDSCMAITLIWMRFVHPICIFPSWEGKAKNGSPRLIVRKLPMPSRTAHRARRDHRPARKFPLDLTTLGSGRC